MKSKIMKRAHEIRRNSAKKFNCKISDIIFSLCLKQAWIENKMNTEIIKWETCAGNKVVITVKNGGIEDVKMDGNAIEDRFMKIVKHPKIKASIGNIGILSNNFDKIKAAIKSTKAEIIIKNKTNAPCPKCGTWCYGDCTN